MAMLEEVGLGYVKVGQQATTLSGGEAQRVKLAKELSRRATGQTLYILDEPTTGLHFEDVRKLLEVLHALVEQGNTVVVIEHNLEVIKTADWVIDLGPEGGDKGGEIVAEGTPEQVAEEPRSYTGAYLKPLLKGARAKVATVTPAGKRVPPPRCVSESLPNNPGEIVAEAEQERHAGGMPQPAKQEDVAKEPRSYTGQYLQDILARSERVEAGPAMKLGKAKARAPKREREAAE